MALVQARRTRTRRNRSEGSTRNPCDGDRALAALSHFWAEPLSVAAQTWNSPTIPTSAKSLDRAGGAAAQRVATPF